MRRLAPLALAACLACYSVGRPIDQATIARLRPGETTQAQALELLGKPSHVVTDHSAGITTLVWVSGSSVMGQARGQSLSVSFGADGKILPAGGARPGILSAESTTP